MRRFYRPLVWGAVFTLVAFWAVAPFVPRKLLFDVLNAVVSAVGLGVIAAYLPGVWITLRTNLASTGHFLVTGIALTWVASNGRTFWNWAWRYYGKPDYMIDHLMVAFFLVVLIMGGILHLAAKDVIEEKVPTRTWRKAGILLSLGFAIGFLFIVFLE